MVGICRKWNMELSVVLRPNQKKNKLIWNQEEREERKFIRTHSIIIITADQQVSDDGILCV